MSWIQEYSWNADKQIFEEKPGLSKRRIHYSLPGLEGPDSFINCALPKKFDEHLSLPQPGRRIWEELEYQSNLF